MIIYIETSVGNFTEGNRTIPNEPENRDFQLMNQQVSDGDATITAYTDSADELEQLRADAYAENVAYYNEQVRIAESNPLGTQLDARKTKKENSKRNNRAKGKSKITDEDDALADHIDLAADSLDSADDAVENLDKAGLLSWSPASIGWPTWVP